MGLVTPDALDVLSHAAVRARNSSVLLASCSDAAALQGLRVLAGRDVELTLSQVQPQVNCLSSSLNCSGFVMATPQACRRLEGATGHSISAVYCAAGLMPSTRLMALQCLRGAPPFVVPLVG